MKTSIKHITLIIGSILTLSLYPVVMQAGAACVSAFLGMINRASTMEMPHTDVITTVIMYLVYMTVQLHKVDEIFDKLPKYYALLKTWVDKLALPLTYRV